jgi:DNA-binding transcriptional MerR regulator
MDNIQDTEHWLTAAECASHMGLTVRALRVYEGCGLITPRRTFKNWRLYGANEFARLTEIIALKQLGLSLSRITELLAGHEADIDNTLAMQQALLLAQQKRAEHGLGLIGAARAKITKGQQISINELITLVKETKMNDTSSDTIEWRRYEQTKPRTEVKIKAKLLNDYVGHYQYDDGPVEQIKLRQGGLLSRLTGQMWLELFPESDSKFFFKVVPAQVSFARDSNNRIMSLTKHQNGLEQTARRIEASKAEKFEADLAHRIKAKSPIEGSEKLLRSFILEQQEGSPDFARLSEGLAQAVREQMSTIQPDLKARGAIKKTSFRGVAEDGCDVYEVEFENDSQQEWRFNKGADGKLNKIWFRPIP